MYQATVKRIAKEDLLSLSRKEHDTVLANCSAMTNHRFASAYDSVIPRRTDDEKDLKYRGFTFVGSTVVYAHMQAVGMVNVLGLHPLLWAAPQERNLHRMADYCEEANDREA
jgi:prephenate dehydrogenase